MLCFQEAQAASIKKKNPQIMSEVKSNGSGVVDPLAFTEPSPPPPPRSTPSAGISRSSNNAHQGKQNPKEIKTIF